MKPIQEHQREIQINGEAWRRKPLLRSIYSDFYTRIQHWVDEETPGMIVEIGSGIGNLKSYCKSTICTDLFPNPWLDLVCDGYELPFTDQSISHLVLFDVFHHLQAPAAFLRLARRVMTKHGRIILFEPFISTLSRAVYGLLHHEPISMNAPISPMTEPPKTRGYYAAQGNATRMFLNRESDPLLAGWNIRHAEAFSACAYLLSGGYSKPAFYPGKLLPIITWIDRILTKLPKLFGGRCLVVLEMQSSQK